MFSTKVNKNALRIQNSLPCSVPPVSSDSMHAAADSGARLPVKAEGETCGESSRGGGGAGGGAAAKSWRGGRMRPRRPSSGPVPAGSGGMLTPLSASSRYRSSSRCTGGSDNSRESRWADIRGRERVAASRERVSEEEESRNVEGREGSLAPVLFLSLSLSLSLPVSSSPRRLLRSCSLREAERGEAARGGRERGAREHRGLSLRVSR